MNKKDEDEYKEEERINALKEAVRNELPYKAGSQSSKSPLKPLREELNPHIAKLQAQYEKESSNQELLEKINKEKENMRKKKKEEIKEKLK